ncbi:hypothetical protein IWZ00DRAFT_541373 [Phyllosticta capitalensis]|uniref:Uncharacterized protein n=1 Tax=Phyllosticta capitalensis TaxID=121624 RepID=A0ABR1Z0U6_9PEZI
MPLLSSAAASAAAPPQRNMDPAGYKTQQHHHTHKSAIALPGLPSRVLYPSPPHQPLNKKSSSSSPSDPEASASARATFAIVSLPGRLNPSGSGPQGLITTFPDLCTRTLSRAIDESPIYRAHRSYSGIDVTRIVLVEAALIVLLAPVVAGALHDMHGEMRHIMAMLGGVWFNIMFGVDIAMAGFWREDKGRADVRRVFVGVMGVLALGAVWSAAVDMGWL